MTVDEQRLRHSFQSQLADLVGDDETGLLMNYLPPVGWADVATTRDLDLLAAELRSEMAVLRSEMAALRSDLQGGIKAQTARILLWLVPALIAGMGVAARLG
jgi:hypothetical protein